MYMTYYIALSLLPSTVISIAAIPPGKCMERDCTRMVCIPNGSDMSRDDDVVSIPALKSSEFTVIRYPVLGGAGGGVQEADIIPSALIWLNMTSIGADPMEYTIT